MINLWIGKDYFALDDAQIRPAVGDIIELPPLFKPTERVKVVSMTHQMHGSGKMGHHGRWEITTQIYTEAVP